MQARPLPSVSTPSLAFARWLPCLEALRASLPEADLASGGDGLGGWVAALEQRLLPRLRGELPLLVGICGGGNAGKSTLFNLLAGGTLSVSGATAGLTRRALLAIPPAVLGQPGGLEPLVAPLGAFPEPLRDRNELAQPGTARYVEAPALSPQLVLIDTPDFNVGDAHGYANRAQAQAVLAACDLLLYVATNQLYSNREALEFMRATLTAVGIRPSVLVYRFDDPGDTAHLRDAFACLERGLYGDVPAPVLLRAVVADDRTAVRAGGEPGVDAVGWGVDGLPWRDACGVHGLRAFLESLDRTGLRARDTRRGLRAVRDRAASAQAVVAERIRALRVFRLALDIRAERAAAEAVRRFPLEAFRAEVACAYHAEESPLERLARQIGRVPAWLRRTLVPPRHEAQPAREPEARSGALGEAQALWRELVEGSLLVRFDASSTWGRQLSELLAVSEAVAGAASPHDERMATVAVPPALFSERESLRALDWAGAIAPTIEAAAVDDEALGDLQETLRAAVRKVKADRSRWEKLKHGFLAGAQVATPFAALAYVVGTGGALLGLLGTKDLGAVVALPVWMQADAELTAVVRQLMEAVVGHWHARRRTRLSEALRGCLVGRFAERTDALLAALSDGAARVDAALSEFDRIAADEGLGAGDAEELP